MTSTGDTLDRFEAADSTAAGSAAGSSVGTRETAPSTSARRPWLWLIAGAAAIALVIAIIGGYLFGWTWTGFTDHGTLWDLLHLLVLPLVVAAVPFWYRTRATLGSAWAVTVAALAVALVIVLIGGYNLGWSWTGFGGATLWDWLELLVLPLALAGLPLWLQARANLGPRHRVALTVGLVAFVGLVFGGYFLNWDWTGFQGNTLWDWLGLLLVPFVLPAVIAWYLTSDRSTIAERGTPSRG